MNNKNIIIKNSGRRYLQTKYGNRNVEIEIERLIQNVAVKSRDIA